MKELDEHMNRAKLNLEWYLKKLYELSDNSIEIQSCWFGKKTVQIVYPSSFIERVVIFIKTLCWQQNLDQSFMKKAVKNLTNYKNAVEYELLVSKPRQYAREYETTIEIKNFLVRLAGLKEPLLSEKDTKEIYEIMGRIDDAKSPLSIKLFKSLIQQESEERSNTIHAILVEIDNRLNAIPQEITNAIQESQIYFQETKPNSGHIENVDLISEENFLFNFFITEKGRFEMARFYSQIETASRIWNSFSPEDQMKQVYRQDLLDFQQFFQKTVEEYGPARDLTNGIAYTDLFYL